METEGDLVSASIVNSVGMIAPIGGWDLTGFKYLDENLNYNEKVFTDDFDSDFSQSVSARVTFYQNREKEGVLSTPGYVQENSGTSALVLKKLVREVTAENEGLVGPRLASGDYYSN